VNPGDDVRVELHLVNDRRTALDDIGVRATVRWAGGSKEWAFGGPVDADDVVKVGTVEMKVPRTLGEMSISVVATDRDGTVVATNRATTAVTLAPD
jgi:beta-mannosidase